MSFGGRDGRSRRALASPEALFLDRRSFLAGLGAAGALACLAGAGGRRRSVGGALSGQAQSGLYARPRRDAGEVQSQLQQFLRVQHQQAHRRKRAENPSLDGQARRPGREGADRRHRFAHQGDGARGASLSPPLRRGLVDGDPWTGFPLSKLVEFAKPLSSATYVRFETFLDKKMAPGQRSFMPWPYVEGLTMAEATNDLAFIATGAYGKPLAKVQGAPIRLATPWKYGFKSIKSIVRISFVDKRPETFWETLGPDEYGFWANVNPGRAASPLEPGQGNLPQRRAAAPDADLQRLRR